MRQQIIISGLVTGGSTADAPEKALTTGQQSQRRAKKTVTARVMRGCHEVISLGSRESSGAESLSGSGNARVLFAGRRRPK